MTTLSTLGSAQLSRAKSLPTQIIAPSPPREIALELPRQRNALLDGFFYDIGKLTSEEAEMLAPRYAAEGAILAVWPSAAPEVRIWPDHATFTSDTSGSYRALTVAGVGSSALGAAAFARNVADAIGGPVLSVVSGYGLADLLTEALGGYFLFGHINLMRHVFETFDEVTRPSTALASNEVRIVRKSLDVRTLSALLSGEKHFDVLVGHSKGNLVISEALYALGETDPQALAHRGKETQVITISARVAMPRAMTRVTDVLGTLDGFGLLNSRLSIRTDEPVPLAWHHTNTELPFHLPVTATLEKILG